MDRILHTSGKNLAVFALAYGAKRLGYVEQDAGVRAMQLLVNILLPMAIIMVVPTVEFEATLLTLPALSLCYALFSVPLLYSLQRRMFAHLARHDRGLLLMCSVGQAVSLIGYPLVGGFYGDAGLARLVVYDLVNVFLAFSATKVCALTYMPSDETMPEGRRAMLGGTSSASSVGPPTSECASHQDGSDIELARRTSHPGRRPEAVAQAIAAAMLREDPEARVPLPSAPAEADGSCPQQAAEPSEPHAGRRPEAVVVRAPRCLLLLRSVNQPPIIGIAAGLALKYAGLQVGDLPAALRSAVAEQAAACGAISFISLGIFAEPSVMFQRAYLRRVAVLLGMRYAVALPVAVAFMWMAAQAGDVLVGKVGGICILMPIPPVVLAYAAQLGYDVQFAAAAVTASLVLSTAISTCYALAAETMMPDT